ncbi:MAG TPA: hypothetical protein VFY71_00250 [Planctomycetota bacterium]|nr:hypothetical protein [Planctomycetota bacterium]
MGAGRSLLAARRVDAPDDPRTPCDSTRIGPVPRSVWPAAILHDAHELTYFLHA